MTTRTYICAAAILAALVTTAASRPASACGPYSPETAAGLLARIMFLRGPEVSRAELAANYPELEPAELSMLTGHQDAYTEAEQVTIDGDRATVIVALVSGDDRSKRRFVVELVAGDPGRYRWRPIAVKPADFVTSAVLSVRAISRRLARAASARLARR